MKSALIAVAATALLGNAAANGLHDRHQGFHNRRSGLELRNDDGEVCGCTTYVTTVTGPATMVSSTPVASPPAAASPPAGSAPAVSGPASSAPVASPPAGSAPAGSAPAPSAPASSAPAPSAPASSAPAPSAPAPVASSVDGGAPSPSSPATAAGVPPTTAAPSSAPATPQAPAPTPIVTSYQTPGTYTIPATTITVKDTTTVCGAETTSLTPGVNTYGGVTTSVVTATTVTCPYATIETTDSTTTSVIKTTTYTCPAGGEYTIVPPYTTSVPEATLTHYPTPATYTPGTYTQPEQVVTITKTNDVYVCPAATPLGGAPASSTPAAATPNPTAGVDGAVGQPSSTPVASGTPAGSAVGTPSASKGVASSTPSAGGSTQSSNGFTHNGNQWAMTYTPYSADGNCRTADGVMTDLKDIKSKGFTTVRLYGTDCDGLKTVGDACKEIGLRMVIGIYIKDTGIDSDEVTEQVTDIIEWGKQGMWSLVDLVVIGNEAVFNGWCTASELAAFITSFKSKVTGAGLELVKFTTTETLNVLQSTEFSALCEVIDIIGVNVQPYFNTECTAEKAGDFVLSQLELAKDACPSITDVLNLESGWPHSGSSNGAASAGSDEQATAIKSIIEKAGTASVIFSYGDDSWKQGGDLGIEPFFGCASQFELISGSLKIGGLELSVDIGSDGIDVDLDLNL